MPRFRDLSISSKLTAIIMVNCCVALLVGGIALAARYAVREEAQLVDRIAVLARVIGDNNAANVTFGDRAAAVATLAALAAEPTILNAYLYDNGGQLFAQFDAAGQSRPPPATGEFDVTAAALAEPSFGGLVFHRDHLLVSSPIMLDGETKGTVLLNADLASLRSDLLHDSGIFALISVVTSMFALALCFRLQNIVSGPIHRLAEAMRRVSSVKDYAIRLEQHCMDEVGTLIEGFNEMLDQLRLRDENVQHHRNQLEHAHRIARLGHWEWSEQGELLTLSEQAMQILGASHSLCRGGIDDFLNGLHDDDRGRVAGAVLDAAGGGRPLDVEFRIVAAGGQVRHVHLRGELTHCATRGKRITGSVQDVSERVHAAASLRIAANALESTSDAILIMNAEWRIIAVNRAFCRDTGYTLDDVFGQAPAMLFAAKNDPALYPRIKGQLASGGSWSGEIWGKRSDGGIYPQWVSFSEVRDEAGALSHYVSVGKDVSQYKEYEARLQFLAHHDALTKLPNRMLFEAQLRESLIRAQRSELNAAVMFIDLDHFKTINDSLGHAVGDQLLQLASERIRNCVRKSDTVARQGGDEFTVLLDQLGDVQDAGRIAEKLTAELARPFVLEGHDLYISASIGISCYPEDGEEPEVLLKKADAAMYVIKEQGRNGYQFYSAGAQQKAIELLTMSNNLHGALSRDEFRIHYQPRIELDTCRIVGFEALIRWQHPELGLLSPAQFVPLAEQTGLIDAIGDWVLEGACRQTKAWHDEGLGPFCVAVNLSVRQFRQAGLVSRVAEILHDSGLEPRFLHVEITESMMMVDYERTAKTLVELHEMGIGIAVDDFGTGYSSLSYLKRFPLDFLKIDKSFVQDIPGDLEDVAITNAIIALARSLKLKIVAEGVETPEQQSFLQQAGCDEAQGYLFSKPLPAAELRRLLIPARSCEVCAFPGCSLDTAHVNRAISA